MIDPISVALGFVLAGGAFLAIVTLRPPSADEPGSRGRYACDICGTAYPSLGKAREGVVDAHAAIDAMNWREVVSER